MSHHRHKHRPRWDFERAEFFGVAIAITVVLTSADVCLLYFARREGHISLIEACNEFFHGFLLILVASFTGASLFRWFRHTEDLFEAFEKFKKLNVHDDIRILLHDITSASLAIKAQPWPQHAGEYLVEKLTEMRSVAQRLQSGVLDNIPKDVAMEHEPNMFLRTKGLIFVTHYGDVDWWNLEHGRLLFDSNKEARRNGCQIIRLFVIPQEPTYLKKNRDKFRDIVSRHIEAGIDVRLTLEADIDPDYRKDIAIFYKDKSGEVVRFVSEWVSDSSRNHDRAIWYFDDQQINFYRRMRRRLEDESTPIQSRAALDQYLSALLEGSGGNTTTDQDQSHQAYKV